MGLPARWIDYNIVEQKKVAFAVSQIWNSQNYYPKMLVFSDVVVHDILDVSNKARRLFLGPFNPNFDICANMVESLEQVIYNHIYAIPSIFAILSVGFLLIE